MTTAGTLVAVSLGRIGPYRMLAEIGRGSTGTVYRARDPAGREVALRQLHAGADHEAHERVLRASTLRIEHPNVVRTLGSGIDGEGRPYLVMELLDGETLRAPLTRGMRARELVDAVRQAALGAAALHAEGLVHRDLAPESLFRCRDGTVKIFDLGHAVRIEEASETIATTTAYRAPEQVASGKVVDARADVWALGVVLYEGLAGFSPFAREGVLATRLAIGLEPLPPITRFAPPIAHELAALVERCLDRDREARVASAEGLAIALATVPIAREAASDGAGLDVDPEVVATIDEARDALGPPIAPIGGGSARTRMWQASVAVAAVLGLATLFVEPPASAPAPARSAPVEMPAQTPQPLPTSVPTRAPTTSREVISDPEGASVWLGERLLGATPLVIDTTAASTIELRLRGYRSERVVVTGEGTLRVVLRRAPPEAPALAPR